MYARKLLPAEVGFRVFSDLKTLHVVISHRKFTGHEFDLGERLKIARGGPSAPALNRRRDQRRSFHAVDDMTSIH